LQNPDFTTGGHPLAFEPSRVYPYQDSSDIETSILINNRAGGNAPLIAERVVKEFGKNQEYIGSTL